MNLLKISSALKLFISLGIFSLIVVFYNNAVAVFIFAFSSFFSINYFGGKFVNLENVDFLKTTKLTSFFCIIGFPFYFLFLPLTYYLDKIKRQVEITDVNWILSFEFSFIILGFLYVIYYLAAVKLYRNINISQSLMLYSLLAVIGIYFALVITTL